MYGSGIGSLEVTVNGAVVWSKGTELGNSWQDAIVQLSNSKHFQGKNPTIAFVATRGSSWASDIAIDNVAFVIPGAPTPAPATPPPTPVPQTPAPAPWPTKVPPTPAPATPAPPTPAPQTPVPATTPAPLSTTVPAPTPSPCHTSTPNTSSSDPGASNDSC